MARRAPARAGGRARLTGISLEESGGAGKGKGLDLEQEEFLAQLDENPVIAAVKDEAGLSRALGSECRVVFLLFGSLLNLAELTQTVRAAGKTCMVHVDLIEGLSLREISVEYVARNTAAHGIISTKQSLVRRAPACGLLAVQRFFLLDSLALGNIPRQYPKESACAIEVLPGLMPKIIRSLAVTMDVPVIAGGLIREKEDVVAALDAGARAVSSTNPAVWFL